MNFAALSDEMGVLLWFININELPETLSPSNRQEFDSLLQSALIPQERDNVLRYHIFDDRKRSLFSYLLQKAAIRNYCNDPKLTNNKIHIHRSAQVSYNN